MMELRDRISLYGTYLGATAAIGFTLPFLPLYLGQEGLSDRAIGWISTFAALSALAQFPIGLWSDRIGTRKPFLIIALALLVISTWLLDGAHGAVWIGFLVILFAENGICRAIVDSLMGAEVTSLASEQERAAELGALRTWKPIGIIVVAVFSSWWAQKTSIGAVLPWLFIVQLLGLVAACTIRESRRDVGTVKSAAPLTPKAQLRFEVPRDPQLWEFIVAIVLFHAANAPGGVYLGLFLKRELHSSDAALAYAFVASMLAWMIVVWPVGRLADRYGRKPLLVLAWTFMALCLLIVAIARTPGAIIANQVLDGAANGLFSVLAATWVTDRLADERRVGEAQVLVGTALVLGSAIGPAISGMLVEWLGYRGLFAGLSGAGAIATAVVILFVPETLNRSRSLPPQSDPVPENDSCLPTTAFTAEPSCEELSA